MLGFGERRLRVCLEWQAYRLSVVIPVDGELDVADDCVESNPGGCIPREGKSVDVAH